MSKELCDIRDWTIRPLRNKKKNKIDNLNGFRHRDIIQYIKRNGEKYIGYITSIDKIKNTISFTDFTGKQFKRYGIKSCKLIQRCKGVTIA